MGFLEDLEKKASPRASRSYRNAFESVECARHADYTEERVLLACIEMNEYISGEFTRVPASYIYMYIYIYPSISSAFRYAMLAPCRIERRVSRRLLMGMLSDTVNEIENFGETDSLRIFGFLENHFRI